MTTTQNTKTATARYAINQVVEVQAFDFEIAGFPMVWMRGTVTEVTPLDGGLWDIMIVVDGRNFQPQIVGKRGGNKQIREVA